MRGGVDHQNHKSVSDTNCRWCAGSAKHKYRTPFIITNRLDQQPHQRGELTEDNACLHYTTIKLFQTGIRLVFWHLSTDVKLCLFAGLHRRIE